MENSEVDIVRSLSSLTEGDIVELKQTAISQQGSPDAFWDMLQMKSGLRGPEAWYADPKTKLSNRTPDELRDKIATSAFGIEQNQLIWEDHSDIPKRQIPGPLMIHGKCGIGRTFVTKQMTQLYDVCVLDRDSKLLQSVELPPRPKNYLRELIDSFRSVVEPAEMRVFADYRVGQSNVLTQDESKLPNKNPYCGLLCLEWGILETTAMRSLSWQLIQDREYRNMRLGVKWYILVAIDDTKEPPTSDSCKIGEPKIWNYCSHVNLIPDPSLCIDIIEELRNKTRG